MTWLGDILSDAFIKLWRKLWHTWETDGDGGAFGRFTGAMLPEYAPFEQIEHALRGASVRFNDATWQLIGGFGRKIGDETVGKIEEGVNKAIADAKAKVDEAKRYIETNLIAPMNTTIEDAKARLNKLGIDMDSLDIDVSKAMSEVSNMKTTISKFKTDIDTLTSNLWTMNGKVTDLNSKANSISTRMGDAEGSLGNLNKAIEDAKARLREHTDLIDKLDARILALEEKKEEEKEKPLFPELPSLFRT